MELQVGVKAILKNSKGQYLLILRRKPLGGSIKWDIPGGRIDLSEHLEDALRRELREEIGSDPEGLIRLLTAQDIILPESNLHVVRLTYVAEFNKEATLSEEHQDFRWVTKKEALSLDIDPYLRQPLEML